MQKDFTSLRQLRQQLPRMSALEAMAFEPDTMTVDEAYGLALADENITQILPEAIVSKRGDETYITLLDPVQPTVDEEVDQTVFAMASTSDEGLNGRRASLPTNPVTSRSVRNDSFPAKPSQSASRPSNSHNRSSTNDRHNRHNPPKGPVNDIAVTADELDEMFAATEAIPPSPTINEVQEKPSKLARFLLKGKFMFFDGHFEVPGSQVARHRIARNKVDYVGVIERSPRTPRKERYGYEQRREKLVKRMAIGAGVGAFAVLAVLGSAFMTNSDGGAEQSQLSPAPTWIANDTIPATTSTLPDAPEQVITPTADQLAAFNEMVAWANANPDKNFSEEFQKALAIGYFNS